MPIGRLDWQDVRPTDPQHRDVWRIADRWQARFAAAFSRTIRAVVTPEAMKRLRGRLRARDIEGAVNAFEWFNPADPMSVRIWSMLSESLQRSYEDVLVQTGKEALTNLKIPLTLISKAIGVGPKGVDVSAIFGLEREFSAMPFSDLWIQEQAAALVTGVSNGQQKMLRVVIRDALSQGRRADDIADEVSQIVGLSARDAAFVERRRALMVEAEVAPTVVSDTIGRLAAKKLVARGKAIGRTELISAANQGIQDSWRVAQEANFITPTQQREWIAAESEKTCPICLDLDGRRTTLDQPFESVILGSVDRPPAHPNCRCTTILVFE